jgi:septum formation protein
VVVTAVDETKRPGESGAALVERLARTKAAAVTDPGGLPVLAADTTVVCDGRLLEKPASPDGARAMLRLLSGRSHEVITGVCVAHAGELRSGIEVTRVDFARLSDAEIDWYVGSGEPMDKAGAYHIGGRGALFVDGTFGSPSNVAGLPVRLARRLLQEAGLELVGARR